MFKNIVCIHHTDSDGILSAAIVKYANPGSRIQFVPFEYGIDINYNIIPRDSQIVIVDCSLKKEQLLNIIGINENIIWIDHHRTSDELFPEVAGIRSSSSGKSACRLTWEYFFRDDEMPIIVKLIDDYDAWILKYSPDCYYANFGITASRMTNPNDTRWMVLLNHMDVGRVLLKSIVESGMIVSNFMETHFSRIRKKIAFESRLDQYSCIIMNIKDIPSPIVFGSELSKYDLGIMYWFDGEKYSFTVVTEKDIDIEELCRRYGGGGHLRIGGFSTTERPQFLDTGKRITDL